MIDVETHKKLLRKRVETLSFSSEVLNKAADIIKDSGMKIADAPDFLRKEWLNDLVGTTNSKEFKRASSNPAEHFLAFVKERSKKPFHVTYRAVDAVARRFGIDIASKFTHVVWPQEIAWAQRMRLDVNPNTATRAAIFLRETEGNPAKMFSKIADLYADAVGKIGYSENLAHQLSVTEIRFNDSVPEFNPLFLKYASRNYSEILQNMTRDKVEILASRAAKDEKQDRSLISARKIIDSTLRFPMRRILNIVALAKNSNISPNELYRIEKSFLMKMEKGEVDLEQGINSPHIAFVTMITDDKMNKELLLLSPSIDIDEDAVRWDVANLEGYRWKKELPSSFDKWSNILDVEIEKWKSAIVSEEREAPVDLISDFAFWLMDVPL